MKKEENLGKLLILGLLLILMSACAFGQAGFDTNMFKTKAQLKELDKQKIKLDLTLTIDNQLVQTTYTLDIINYNTGVLTTIEVSNKFVLYLDYGNEYEISVSTNNTNTKAILVNTDAPYDNYYIITSIGLTSFSNTKIFAGGIKYDLKKNTFIKYTNG